MGSLLLYPPSLLGFHWYPIQKEFLKSCEGFMRAALTVHGHPSPVWKIAKMALFEKILGQMTSFEVLLKCHFLTLSKKCLRLRPAPSKCLSGRLVKLDYLNNPSQDFKNSFCLWFLWISSNARRQNQRDPIFLRFNMVK